MQKRYRKQQRARLYTAQNLDNKDQEGKREENSVQNFTQLGTYVTSNKREREEETEDQ
jgi:hypothetical protein